MSDNSAYLGIFLRVFDDLVTMSPEYTLKEARLDRQCALDRYKSEGLSFLTKTLPALMKHLESALETGTFVPFPSFKREKGRTTPAFMRTMFKELFDEKGVLGNRGNRKSAAAVAAIRQVCSFMYKFDADYPPELVDEVIQRFVDLDQELTHCEEVDREQRIYLVVASRILYNIFRDFDVTDIRPRPGPGASASGTHKSKRYEPLTMFTDVHEAYPYYRYFYMSSKHLLDRVGAYRSLPRKKSGRSVLRTVPKDSRGPRIICMEEQEYMFLQQGLGDAMRDWVMKNRLTRGHVNFDDQMVNRDLALRSSLSREYATLDMKEASDRISKVLVQELFSELPALKKCLLALSTNETQLPNGAVIKTKKFAPMGSSLCFPIMSVVHFALGVAAMHVHTARPVGDLAKEIFVYGDDIIVANSHVQTLFEVFPKFGLMFNTGKSFYKGHFRESCGCDAFRGRDVTPQRLKRRFFDGRDPNGLHSVMAMHGLLEERGFMQTASMLRTVTESRFGRFPSVGKNSVFLGWTSRPPLSADMIAAIKAGLVSSDSDSLLSRLGAEEVEEFNVLNPVWDSDIHEWTVSARVMKTEPDAMMAGGWEQLMRQNLDAHRSARLDGRWKRQTIVFQRVPYQQLIGECSSWVPKPRIDLLQAVV